MSRRVGDRVSLDLMYSRAARAVSARTTSTYLLYITHQLGSDASSRQHGDGVPATVMGLRYGHHLLDGGRFVLDVEAGQRGASVALKYHGFGFQVPQDWAGSHLAVLLRCKHTGNQSLERPRLPGIAQGASLPNTYRCSRECYFNDTLERPCQIARVAADRTWRSHAIPATFFMRTVPVARIAYRPLTTELLRPIGHFYTFLLNRTTWTIGTHPFARGTWPVAMLNVRKMIEDD